MPQPSHAGLKVAAVVALIWLGPSILAAVIPAILRLFK